MEPCNQTNIFKQNRNSLKIPTVREAYQLQSVAEGLNSGLPYNKSKLVVREWTQTWGLQITSSASNHSTTLPPSTSSKFSNFYNTFRYDIPLTLGSVVLPLSHKWHVKWFQSSLNCFVYSMMFYNRPEVQSTS